MLDTEKNMAVNYMKWRNQREKFLISKIEDIREESRLFVKDLDAELEEIELKLSIKKHYEILSDIKKNNKIDKEVKELIAVILDQKELTFNLDELLLKINDAKEFYSTLKKDLEVKLCYRDDESEALNEKLSYRNDIPEELKKKTINFLKKLIKYNELSQEKILENTLKDDKKLSELMEAELNRAIEATNSNEGSNLNWDSLIELSKTIIIKAAQEKMAEIDNLAAMTLKKILEETLSKILKVLDGIEIIIGNKLKESLIKQLTKDMSEFIQEATAPNVVALYIPAKALKFRGIVKEEVDFFINFDEIIAQQESPSPAIRTKAQSKINNIKTAEELHNRRLYIENQKQDIKNTRKRLEQLQVSILTNPRHENHYGTFVEHSLDKLQEKIAKKMRPTAVLEELNQLSKAEFNKIIDKIDKINEKIKTIEERYSNKKEAISKAKIIFYKIKYLEYLNEAINEFKVFQNSIKQLQDFMQENETYFSDEAKLVNSREVLSKHLLETYAETSAAYWENIDAVFYRAKRSFLLNKHLGIKGYISEFFICNTKSITIVEDLHSTVTNDIKTGTYLKPS